MKSLPVGAFTPTMLRGTVLLALVGLAWCEDTSPDGGELIIRKPAGSEISEDPIEARPAWFGFPVYNGEFIGVIKYSETKTPTETGCKTCGCSSYPTNEFETDAQGKETKGNVIALIDRGDCNFVEKVYQAQTARAAGVIIMDNKGEGWLPIMADDGTGDRVQIPSIIISQEDGEKIKQYLTAHPNDNPVQVEIAWGLPRPDGRVEWELWMPPNPNTSTRKFIQDFEEVMEILGADKMEFRPMYKLYQNDQGQMGYDDQVDCTNAGKYCWPSDRNVVGKSYVEESLTQICVAQYSNSTKHIDAWWRYMTHFNQKCVPQSMGKGWNGACSKEVINAVQLELTEQAETPPPVESHELKDYVKECFAKSGNDCHSEGCAFDAVENIEFEAQITNWEEYFPYSEYFPRVTINEHNYHGAVRCPHPISLNNCGVLAALCAAYEDSQKPAACTNNGCAFGEMKDACGICGGDGKSCQPVDKAGDVALAIVLPLVIVCVVLAVVTAWYIKGRLQSHDSQFTALQALYEPLSEQAHGLDGDVNSGNGTMGSPNRRGSGGYDMDSVNMA